MRRQVLTRLLPASCLILAGCHSMPQHSNTLFFGTNTTVGLRVGAEATQTPAIQIGYDRQELAIVPLLANQAPTGGEATVSASPGIVLQPAGCAPNCLFVGTDGNGQDTYSVIGSFGADLSGNASSSTASVGLAQYFATGLAARRLAGFGSSLVAVGEAASEASKSAPQIAAQEAEIKKSAAEIQSSFDMALPTVLDYVGDGKGKVDEAKIAALAKLMEMSPILLGTPPADGRTLADFGLYLKRNHLTRTSAMAAKIAAQ